MRNHSPRKTGADHDCFTILSKLIIAINPESMKYVIFFLFSVSSLVAITYTTGHFKLMQDSKISFIEDASKIDYEAIIAKGVVQYRDFGAQGDGKTDDLSAIVKAHAFANQEGLQVKAEDGAEYYIGGKKLTAIIQTDTDFGTAKFIIDDRSVEDYRSFVFEVKSDKKGIPIEGISNLQKFQQKIDARFPGPSIVTITVNDVMQYIRYGGNQNNGFPKSDIILVDQDGNISEQTPLIWDFEHISSMKALPIDEDLLQIKGGAFITIANNMESSHPYFNRGIAVRRSHVEIDGIKHFIEGEGDQGAPYAGFINIGESVFVTVRNSIFTGHKVFRVMGRGGVEVNKGTYDLTVNRSLHVSFINCTQSNDIHDRTFWGLMASNYSKNLVLDNCIFSRFDAHMGVYNATILNSTLGHQGINAIGSGTFLLENSTVHARNLINLRQDYGSTWEGEFIIRNCVFVPENGRPVTASLIGGQNQGQHDFGYPCFMPMRIVIDNLHIDDSNHPSGYKGASIFANFNKDLGDKSYVEKFSFKVTQEIILQQVTTASGIPLRVSDNEFMFRDVKILEK